MKNRLEQLCKERGISREELTGAPEVSAQTTRSLENGGYNPLVIPVFKFIKYLGMSMEDIFIYEGAEPVKDVPVYCHFKSGVFTVL